MMDYINPARKRAEEEQAQERIRIISDEERREALHKVGNRKRRRQLAAQLRRA